MLSGWQEYNHFGGVIVLSCLGDGDVDTNVVGSIIIEAVV